MPVNNESKTSRFRINKWSTTLGVNKTFCPDLTHTDLS